MSYNSFSEGFTIGEIVWARHNHDGIYWPGRITFITNNSNEILSTDNNFQYQSSSYLIQFFGYTQTNWTTDVLPYRSYRDYMSKNLLVHYESHPQIKYQLLNAIHQADFNEGSTPIRSANLTSVYSSKNNPNITDSHNLTSQTANEHSLNYYYQYPSNYFSNSQPSLNTYCSCYTQPYFQSTNQLSIETNSIQSNNDYHSLPSPQTDDFRKTNSVTIITTKTYSNSSFISYLFNCLFTFYHRSIFYIDELTNYQHPNTSNISYFICLDHFDTTIKQILDTTILNNLNVHINYLFLVINAPSNLLITHLYSTIMDKRTILILHYHSAFDNDPLLLCSGDRTTFKMIESSLLKYLCSNVKYIEEQEELYSNSSVLQSTNIKDEPITDIPNQILEPDCFPNMPNECLSSPKAKKQSKKLSRRRMLNNLDKRILKRKLKKHIPRHRIAPTSPSEYDVKNILEHFDSSK